MATTEPVELVQMWVVPDEGGVAPGYEQLQLAPSDLAGKLAVVASGMAAHRHEAAIRIQNRWAALHVGRLLAGQTVTVPDAPFVHIYVAKGRADLEGAGVLDFGDAARLTDAGARRVHARLDSEVLVWEMHRALG